MDAEFIFDSDDFVSFCHNFDQTASEELTDSLLEVYLLDLNDRWLNLRKSYRSLSTFKEETPGFLEAARGKFNSCTASYHKCKSRMLDLQKILLAPQPATPFGIPPQPNHSENDYASIKVPPCDTEVFYGGYEEWPSFRDLFTAVYVDHPKLSAVQKLYHLRLKVRGQAGVIVKKYKLCGENFSLAWEALTARYENKRILVDNQLKILLNLKPIVSESSESLQSIQSSINDVLAALKAQHISTADWDPILVYQCSTKLPHETLSLWEQSLESHKELPRWEQMDKFLSNRYEVVERLNSIQGIRTDSGKKVQAEINTFNTESTIQFPCKICKNTHSLKNCPDFKKLDVQARYDFVSKSKICLNCLSYTHFRKDCTSKFTCAQCKKNHHTLLHFTKPNTELTNQNPFHNRAPEDDNSSDPSAQALDIDSTSTHFASGLNKSSTQNTLLPTAIVQVEHRGEKFNARAFLDQGSEKSFISKKLQQRLMLLTEVKNFQIRGFGGQLVGNANSICNLTLTSAKFDKNINIQAIVVPKITRLLPSFSLLKSDFLFEELTELELADPEFHSPGQVDLLLGSNVIPKLLLEGVKTIGESLLAQQTIYGWMISGPVEVETFSAFSIAATEVSNEELAQQIQRFWELEEVPTTRPLHEDEEYCQSLYETTTKRNIDGRYIVKLPFKSQFPNELSLGASRSSAMGQYFRMESNLKNKPELAGTYRDILNEYVTLNHMEPTCTQEKVFKDSYSSYYLPHHAVMKPESHSTKVRIVFNASKRTTSGNSLNDVLHVGPTLQADLMTLILNWRLYPIVFNGDIEKMYRQILVHSDDQPFQRILFRPDPTGPIQDYSLKTVTFGVNCAPYLAIRTLIQLAHDSIEKFPQAAHILRKETYVDDILSGAHDVESAIESLAQTITLLDSAGFPLKKITSNCPKILGSVKKENLLDSNFLKFHETSATKTLGIQWNALSDCFSYSVDHIPPTTSITKRQILSSVSKLFDPAGWVSPIVIRAKILLQQLWLEGIDWDDNVKPITLLKWNNFTENLSQISNFKIPRWVNFSPSIDLQIHGFCDASEKAYCAVVYLRTQDPNSISINLLVSKTKVAPLDPLSLPRLELCSAVLLSKLIKQLTNSLNISNYDLYLWSDSSIVLAWLEKPPLSWKTYVANRTGQIIRNVGNTAWRHVRSADNPADLGTRGCTPDELLNSSLWWHGPGFLQNPPEEWPISLVVNEIPPERKKIEIFHTTAQNDNTEDDQITEYDILNDFSTWDKALRTLTYVYRFIDQTRKLANIRKYDSQSQLLNLCPKKIPNAETITLMIKNIPHISRDEFLDTKKRQIVLTQKRHYEREHKSLLTSKKISKKSSLFTLNPCLDTHNVMRVNGRISEADFSFNERHPIIIPVNSRYMQLFISFTHHLLMHAEHNLMIRAIRQEYYVSRLRSGIRKCIRACITCIIYKKKVHSQMMAALPSDRSSFSLPFSTTGLDFAGPFATKTSILRNAPYHKSFVCVFVCFCTKALHLELCSDLTSGSFQAAFTRFVGRRGLPHKVMSDNGTNFVGAERALRREYEEFLKVTSKDIGQKYSCHGFQWSFIPPNAPHMGGLWEAGVKSFKMHFKKVVHNQKFTFEEFTTLLARIEAVLNSRPLSSMSDDPNELLALTPGHFLRGAPLTALPEAPAASLTLCDRWERLKSLQHQFAQRWKDEYLKELQKRYKWQVPKENIKIGQLVVIKDDLLPPCEWRLGRIEKVYLGNDGLVRVADIKTHSGITTRAIVKLCVLPVDVSPTA